MKTLYKLFILFAILHLLIIPDAISQVSINTDGSSPDPSAMLEIKSDNRGLLLPRLDFNNRPLTPAAGLLIYVTVNGPMGSGLYFFDGTGWIKLLTPSYSIGQHFGGGIIFYIDPSGQHGLIASELDQPSNYPYGDNTIDITGATGTVLGTGLQNTSAIVAADPTPGTAARVCDTSAHAGFNDWYLPSIDEVDSMYVHQSIIGGFDPVGWYWSSSQQSTPAAWIVTFDYPIPNEGWTNKEGYLRVRCIRNF